MELIKGGKKKEEKQQKKKRERKKKKGDRKDRKVNQYNDRVPFRGGFKAGASSTPPPILAEIGHLSLCGHLRQKKNAPNRAN